MDNPTQPNLQPTPTPPASETANPGSPAEQLTPAAPEVAQAPTQRDPVAVPVIPLPQPTPTTAIPALDPTAASPVPTTDTPAIADDVDVIEKEWVDKTDQVIKETAGDPHREEEAIEDLQIDYLKKRYGKDVKKGD